MKKFEKFQMPQKSRKETRIKVSFLFANIIVLS